MFFPHCGKMYTDDACSNYCSINNYVLHCFLLVVHGVDILGGIVDTSTDHHCSMSNTDIIWR